MKIGTNLILLGILSMLVGSAFASPLLISELEIGEIKPFEKPPAISPTSNITSEVLYANFSINPNSERDTVTDISYFVVLNITNNSDEPANVTFVQFDAEVQNYTLPGDDSDGTSRGESGRGWTAEGAWVDGVWYNLTWVPNKQGKYGEDGFYGPYEEDSEGCWIEGVQIYELYINYELAYTRINMNGTWVDVTGRIEVTRPEGWPPTEPVMDGIIVSEVKSLVHDLSWSVGRDIPMMQRPPSGTPEEFNELWAPHQSRLIVITDARVAPSKYFEPAKLDKLKTEQILFTSTVTNWVTVDNWTIPVYSVDSTQVSLELTENGYLYSILPENQMFVMDSFGVEAFIEPRN